VARDVKSLGFVVSTATKNGPLVPGPKPEESRSKPTRSGDPLASDASSGKPIWIDRAGEASTPTRASDSSAGMIGLRCSSAPYAAQREVAGSSGFGCRAHGIRRPSARRPRRESSAGSIHSAESMTMSTATAAATARPLKNVMRRTNMPSRATITVDPAKATAFPAVPTDSRTAAFGSRPLRTPWLNRFMTKRA
jgi:hypothetical protein